MAKSFYKLPEKDIKSAAEALLSDGVFVVREDGYLLAYDADLLQNSNFETPRSVFILHRNDFLVKSNEHTLKSRFNSPEFDTLHYILVDGEFRGAVVGKFKYGPYIIEDVILDLTQEEAARKDEIYAKIY
ncbi:hypothetical protein FACS1894202_14910 [Clostridia bacterium]|nr:hypothetical protein FACS1894202_14910 [Clostridia bacterium]